MRSRDPERHPDTGRIQPQHLRACGSACQRADQAGRMVAARVAAHGSLAQARVDLPADDIGFNQPDPRRTEHFPERERGGQDVRGAMGNRLSLNLVIQAVKERPVGERGRGRIRPEVVADHGALWVAADLLQVIAYDGRQRLSSPCEHVCDAVQDADFCCRDDVGGQSVVARFSDESSQRVGCACLMISFLHDGLASFE